jgi:4-alpha-glucanotransferase
VFGVLRIHIMAERTRETRRQPAPDRWGIDDGYEDALGVWHETPDRTRQAILRAMGAEGPARLGGGVLVQTPERRVRLRERAELVLEDGTALPVERELPSDLPLGYHELKFERAARPTRFINSPGRCVLPAAPLWGWAVQVYATRSRGSWGMGDLGDLRRIARWAADQQAGIVLINPLHATSPVEPQEPSPYFPGSRRYRNPLYLCAEALPGFERDVELRRLAARGRELNASDRIDRDAVFRLKMTALERVWACLDRDPVPEHYRADQGPALREFATFCALAERHGRSWPDWPAEYRHPAAPAVARFAEDHAGRVRFHEWLQWLLDGQLADVSAELPIVQDLPIGFAPGGADAWAWQDVIASGATVGAPPDEFNTRGQNWALPPFVPHQLQAAGYEPFVQTIRASLRHAGGLRFDHVMGLRRLFWIPRGMDPAEGAYVRNAADDLLAIVALESHRAQAFIVGEDLGTVEEDARDLFARHRLLSYRLVWFEEPPPRRYPRQALAAVTTHDLPTIAGLWTGSDLEAQHALGLHPNEAGIRAIRRRLARMTRLPADAPVEEVVGRTYERLAEAPSLVLAATLEDALAVEDRPNMPATTTEWPNWSIPLPVPWEEIEHRPLPRRIAIALAGRQRKRRA